MATKRHLFGERNVSDLRKELCLSIQTLVRQSEGMMGTSDAKHFEHELSGRRKFRAHQIASIIRTFTGLIFRFGTAQMYVPKKNIFRMANIFRNLCMEATEEFAELYDIILGDDVNDDDDCDDEEDEWDSDYDEDEEDDEEDEADDDDADNDEEDEADDDEADNEEDDIGDDEKDMLPSLANESAGIKNEIYAAWSKNEGSVILLYDANDPDTRKVANLHAHAQALAATWDLGTTMVTANDEAYNSKKLLITADFLHYMIKGFAELSENT